ncbi:hypothetical protein WA026_019478 [Henosepilachna vigintioctopunctata]|uniref:Uncharacterized protein n=1 Tax=Henosepilachna vigintioctopunctata TaxID=420089 RepID=A0AAW1U9M3_9CUCU
MGKVSVAAGWGDVVVLTGSVLCGALSLTQLDYEEEIEDVNDENHEFDLLSAAKCLNQYGYLSENYTITFLQEKNYEDDILSQAILKFQDFYDITGDGILNNETIQLMKKPRCGVQDHPKKFIYRDRTLLHEIGHSLGLFHSSVIPSVMYSFYNESRSILELERDDIFAIQSLYGKPKRFNVRNKKVLTSPTMRTSTTTTSDVISLNPPNLCTVNNNIDRILVVNNHLYSFYKDWVWVISLNKKRIAPPMKLKNYI